MTEVQDDLNITLVTAQDAQTQLNDTIIVAGGDIPDGANIPVADAGPDQNVHNNDVVTLDGSDSADADGDLITYAWSIVSKPTGSLTVLLNETTVTPTLIPDLDGSYIITLVVYDGTIYSAPDDVNITSTLNVAPVANAGDDQNVSTNTDVTLNGTGTDADGDGLTSSWIVVSIPTGSAAVLDDSAIASPSFTADLDGIYEFTYTVNDGTVDSNPDTVIITATDGTTPPVYGTVTSPSTGKVWHDRNLGATQVCTSAFDAACYGDYYQWGRNADGHQLQTSATTSTQAIDVTTVGHSDFIAITAYTYDWGSDVDSNGATRKTNWSATDGSSVCPVGFRLPTVIELNNEILNEDIGFSVTPYDSFLKLPSAGGRYANSGTIYGQGSFVYLWSSDVSGTESYSMYYTSYGDIDVTTDVARGGGIAVRCIQQ